MKLYLDNDYANMDAMINDGNLFHWIIGGRGTGKTYGSLDYILREHPTFLYIRRTQTEADLVTNGLNNPFKNIQLKYGVTVLAEKMGRNLGRFYTVDEDATETIGYIGALSTFASIRGIEFMQDVSLILYDECIPEKRARPIKEEFNALMNLYETVNRNRELEGRKAVNLVCLSNSNDIANPYFIGLQIVNRIAKMMQKGSEVYRDDSRKLSVYMLMHSKISDRKAKTALYQLTGDGDFADMALSNMFELDDQSISPRRISEYRPLVQIGELIVYKHKSRQEFYLSCHASGTVPVTYGTSDIDVQRFLSKYDFLFMKYINDNIYFEDATSLVLFEKYFL